MLQVHYNLLPTNGKPGPTDQSTMRLAPGNADVTPLVGTTPGADPRPARRRSGSPRHHSRDTEPSGQAGGDAPEVRPASVPPTAPLLILLRPLGEKFGCVLRFRGTRRLPRLVVGDDQRDDHRAVEPAYTVEETLVSASRTAVAGATSATITYGGIALSRQHTRSEEVKAASGHFAVHVSESGGTCSWHQVLETRDRPRRI